LEILPEGSGSILILDKEGKVARIYASYGLNEALIHQFEIPVQPERLYTFGVLLNQKPAMFYPADLKPHYQDKETLDLHFGRTPAYQYSVPLIWQGESIGIVSLNNYDPNLPITEDQSEFIRQLSLNLSYHFSNARTVLATEENERQIEKQKRDLELRVAERTWELEISKSRLLTIHEIIQKVIRQKDLQTASEVFLEEALAVIKPEGSGSVFIYDQQKGSLRLYASRGLSGGLDTGFELYPEPGKMYNYKVITDKTPMNFSKEELSAFYTDQIKSYHYGRIDVEQFSVPMTIGDDIIGMMVISHYDENQPFHEDDFQFLINLNVGLSHHFANVRLLEETRRKAQALKETRDKLLQIQHITQDVIQRKNLKEASEVLLDNALNAIRPNGSGSVFIYYEKENQLRIYASRGLADTQLADFALTVGPRTMYNYQVITEQKVLLFRKEDLKPFYTPEIRAVHFDRVDAEQYSIPMLNEGVVIGMLVVSHYTDDQPFSEDEKHFLNNLTLNLSQHFANTKLLEETQVKERIIAEQNINLERKVQERTSALSDALEKLEIQHNQLVQAQQQLMFFPVLFVQD
jgi:GAF domain-containing protein